jgi:hypothetical protein
MCDAATCAFSAASAEWVVTFSKAVMHSEKGQQPLRGWPQAEHPLLTYADVC